MENYFIGVLLLLCAAIFSLLFKKQELKLKFITIMALIASGFCVYDAISVFIYGKTEQIFNMGYIFQNARFSLDYLSAFFVVFISVMTSLALIYSNGYLKQYINKGKDLSAHCVFLPLLLASMLGVVAVQNALLFIIVWELLTLSSFFLVIFC